jgi:TolB-like protein/Flp pilus assembly protein TadD
MATHAQLVGQTLGHYRILEQIGAGGMGVVYRARDEQLERDVAVKVLPTGVLIDDAARKRFRKEALTLAKLNHPHIETVYEFGTSETTDFLVTEYIPGVTLSAKLAARALPEKEVVNLGMQLVAGLDAAHKQGVIHRDLKPSNLRVTPDGHLKILDFGIARLNKPDAEVNYTATTAEPETLAGTLPYMAPEQLRGEQVDERSDIWAAGAVLYEMATGKRPFEAKLSTALINEIIHKPPASPRQIKPNLTPELEHIVLKCLDKDPENRYQSAKELGVDLRRLAVPATSTVIAALPRARKTRRRVLAVIGGIAAVALLFAFNVGSWRDRLLGGGAPHIRSLAVLPLENLSRDPDQEYFADGMTEALINDLSKIGALRVISRTSAMHFKGMRKTLPEIARELNVDGVVEGSIQRSGQRVRITAQLIEARTDTHLWGESYERDLRDVLALQEEVARDIASSVKTKLTPQELASLNSNRQVNPEAHEAYLKGRYFWNKRTEEGLKQGLKYFQKAIDLDPNYALGYAGLADSYVILGENGYLAPRETHPKAKAAVMKALEIDDSLAEAHTSLAEIMEIHDFDWQGAEREFKRAIELNPGYATAHQWYAFQLSRWGRLEESIAESKRALELDPLSLIINLNLGRMLYHARRYDQALQQLRKTLEIDPNFSWTHFQLGLIYEQKGMYEEAIAEQQKSVSSSEVNSIRLGALGRAYAVAGKRNEALKVVEQLKALSKQRYVEPTSIAQVQIALGDKDEAFKWLEKAYQERSIGVPALKTDARFDKIRSDPRFQDLMRRMGLPP